MKKLLFLIIILCCGCQSNVAIPSESMQILDVTEPVESATENLFSQQDESDGSDLQEHNRPFDMPEICNEKPIWEEKTLFVSIDGAKSVEDELELVLNNLICITGMSLQELAENLNEDIADYELIANMRGYDYISNPHSEMLYLVSPPIEWFDENICYGVLSSLSDLFRLINADNFIDTIEGFFHGEFLWVPNFEEESYKYTIFAEYNETNIYIAVYTDEFGNIESENGVEIINRDIGRQGEEDK